MNKSAKYGIVAVLAVAMLILPGISSAQTSIFQQIQSQLQGILQQVQSLQTQLTQFLGLGGGGEAEHPTSSTPSSTPPGTPPVPEPSGGAWCYTFNTNLGIGSTGEDVTALHTALTKEGFNQDDPSGAYGESTAAAVSGFQEKYAPDILTPAGLQYGTGYAGPSTRAELNKLYGCGTGTTATSTASQPVITSLSPSSGPVGTVVKIYGSGFAVPPGSGAMHDFLVPQPVTGFTQASPNDIYFGNQKVSSVVSGDGTTLTFTVPQQLSGCPNANGVTVPVCQGFSPVNPGNNPYPVWVVNANGTSNKVDFTVASSTTPQSSVSIISPAGGEQWQIGSTQKIIWTGLSDATNTSVSLQAHENCEATSDGAGVCVSSVGSNFILAAQGAQSPFTWTVGTDVYGHSIPAGQYKLVVSGGASIAPCPGFDLACGGSYTPAVYSNPFTITAATSSSVSLGSFYPAFLLDNSAAANATLTISGSGFTPHYNLVHAEDGTYNHAYSVDSADGTHLTLRASSIFPAEGCSVTGVVSPTAGGASCTGITMGNYTVYVTNANGESNRLTYTISATPMPGAVP